MTRRAVLVVGPEASGTRLVTRILIAAGCSGDANHLQSFDWFPPDGASPIVWRRSLPHDNLWPDLPAMVRELRREGYAVSAVATDRKDAPMAQAQARDHVKSVLVAQQHIARARAIIEQLDSPSGAALPVVHVRYEKLVLKPERTMRRICEPLGLPVPEGIDIYNGNRKYERAEAAI